MKAFDRTPLTRLSQKKPGIPSSECVYAFDVANALKDFLYDNFRGLASLEIDSTDSTVVKISTEYLAYAVKLLLKYVDGRSFVSIKASVSSSALDLRFDLDSSLSFAEKEQSSILSAVSNAGFEFCATSYGFSLRAKAAEKQAAAYVYANGPGAIKKALFKMFFE